MADIQNACLSKIVIDGDLQPFIDQRITADFFADRNADVWGLVMEHYGRYGKAPDESVVHKAWPTYEFYDYPEPTSYYLNQLLQDRKKVILTQHVAEYAARLEQDEGPAIGDELEQILRQGMAQAAHEISQGRDSDFFVGYERILERLDERMANPGYLRGITTGMDGLDRITGGLQPEQLITFIGTPKAGKSSMLLNTALAAHSAGNTVLFVTFEMSTEEQEDRLLSIITGVDHTKIMNGTLSRDERKLLGDALRHRRNMEGFIFSSDINSATTISGVQAKVNQYQPTIVIVDGVYLMDDELGQDKGSPQALTNITRGFKRMAQNVRRPILISTQALIQRSRGGLSLASIGYSSSFAQDSDIIFGVERHERFDGVSVFSVIAARSAPKGSVNVRVDWSQGIIAELSEAEMEDLLNAAPPVGGGRNLIVSSGKQRPTVAFEDD